MNLDHLDWPFFDDAHRALGREIAALTAEPDVLLENVDDICRAWVVILGRVGLLRHCVPSRWGGGRETLDSRSLCVARESLAYRDALADFAFAMQGLGSGPITLAGTDAQRDRWLPGVARGETIAAFALSEPGAGSDVAALSTRARRVGDGWTLDGCKTWISNAGIADFYCVFARTGDEPGARGISAFLVEAGTPGLLIARGNVARDTLIPDMTGFRDWNFNAGTDNLLGERLRDGYDIGAATAVNDPSKMSEFDRVALERDEKFNTRISGYIGWEQAGRKLIPTPRNAARFDLTQMVLASGAVTTAEAVDYLAARTLRVPASSTMRAALIQFLTNELGTESLDRAKSYMEDALRMTMHLVMSTPEYQIV